MATTGAHLKIKKMGDNVLGVVLEGNPKKPEPIHFRVCFPFGDVDIVRCSDGKSYWVHVRKNTAQDASDREEREGRLIEGRIDVLGKHASDCDAGDFENPDAYHVAVRIGAA